MNTYEYVINQIEAYIEQDGLQNVVYKIHWELRASDADGNMASFAHTLQLDAPSTDSFVPSDNLTKETVIGWIDANYGFEDVTNGTTHDINTLKAQLDARIERQKQPVNTTTIVLPSEETTIEETTE